MSHFQNAIADGVFTIEQVKSALRNEGYIMEGRGTVGRVCTRTLIGSIESRFESYCRDNGIPIDDNLELSVTATDEGDPLGGHRYLAYNSKRYTLKQAMTLLVTVNKAEKVIRELEEKTL